MTDYRLILKTNIEALHKAANWLEASYRKCSSLDLETSEELPYETMEAFEALASRFARVCDILLQKVFRSIEEIELTSGGTLLDVIHRFQKRGIEIDADKVRYMREIRNRIAHEYAGENLNILFKDLLSYSNYLNGLVTQSLEYAEKLLENEQLHRF